MIGGDIYVVNAEYAWRDHSWYATLSFSFFFLPPLPSPLTPILSLLSLPPFPHILFFANFNPLPCSSSPASRFCGDVRSVHRAVSRRHPPRDVRRALRRPCVQDVLQNKSILAAFPFWYATLVSPSSPP